jgi:replication factor C small subunit
MKGILDQFGLAGTDLVNQLHRELGDVTFLDEVQKLGVTEAMAEADFRMVEGGGESLQLDAMAARICMLLGN